MDLNAKGNTRITNASATRSSLQTRTSREPTITGGTRVAVGVTFLVNAINWSFETLGNYEMADDRTKIEEHRNLLATNVAQDLDEAINRGIIPGKYRNQSDLGSIANVVLSGYNPTKNEDIYNIGIQITKEISGNYRAPLENITPNTPQSVDNTRVDKTVIVPKQN